MTPVGGRGLLAVHLGDCLDEVIYSVLGAVSTSLLASILVPILALLVSSALSSSFTLILALILWPIIVLLLSSVLVWASAGAAVRLSVGVSGGWLVLGRAM